MTLSEIFDNVRKGNSLDGAGVRVTLINFIITSTDWDWEI